MKKTDPLNAAAEQPTKVQAKRPVNHSGFYCYIGPNLAGLIQHGTIFRGSWDDALKAAAAAIEKYPLVKSLIVSGDALPAERLKVKKPGNALYENYRKLAGKQEV
jgi:hypothetical protein